MRSQADKKYSILFSQTLEVCSLSVKPHPLPGKLAPLSTQMPIHQVKNLCWLNKWQTQNTDIFLLWGQWETKLPPQFKISNWTDNMAWQTKPFHQLNIPPPFPALLSGLTFLALSINQSSLWFTLTPLYLPNFNYMSLFSLDYLHMALMSLFLTPPFGLMPPFPFHPCICYLLLVTWCAYLSFFISFLHYSLWHLNDFNRLLFGSTFQANAYSREYSMWLLTYVWPAQH